MSDKKTNMLLQDLKLHNFKGIRDFSFTPGGASATVYGANESGKTTLNDGLTYVLFGKDSQNRQDSSFGIKTRGEDGKELSGLEHSVEGVFSNMKLKRVYKENYTKKRGAAFSTLTGHTTEYFVDDVPKSKKEFDEVVSQVLTEEIFKMLTVPDYFVDQMKWQDRRAVLVQLAGEIEVQDIINGRVELQRYPDILEGKSHDDRVTILKRTKKEYNEQLKGIPERIDEITRLIKDVDGVDEAKKAIEELQGKKSTIEAKKNSVKSGGVVAELQNELTKLEGENLTLKNKLANESDNGLSELRNDVRKIDEDIHTKSSQKNKLGLAFQNIKSETDSLNAQIASKEETLKLAREEEPKEDTGEVPCPVCEQPMKSEQTYEEYLEEFNAKKAEKVKNLTEEVETLQEQREAKQKELEPIRVEGKELEDEIKELVEKRKGLVEDIESAKSKQVVLEETDEYKEIIGKESGIKEKLSNHEEEKRTQLQALDKSINDIDAEIKEHETLVNDEASNKKYNERIVELRSDMKRIAEELENIEADMFIIENFVKARSEYITGVVNTKFEGVEWRLFKDQLNGGVDECCDAIGKDGVPYNEGMNNAQKVQVGISVVNTLQKHFGVALPVFIDNRESVTSLPDTGLQTVSLVVSPQDKKLRVELKEEAVTA